MKRVAETSQTTQGTNLINDAFVCVKIQSEAAVVLLDNQARVALHGLCADTLGA